VLNQPEKTEIVVDLIKEDRAEVRFQEEKIYTIVTNVIIASFAISAFILGNSTLSNSLFGRILLPGVDLALGVILSVTFWQLQRNLNTAQSYLQRRQQFFEQVANPKDSDASDFHPIYGLPPLAEPLITHLSVQWIFGVSIGVLIFKFLALVWSSWFLAGQPP
jgi:hypothetical protein